MRCYTFTCKGLVTGIMMMPRPTPKNKDRLCTPLGSGGGLAELQSHNTSTPDTKKAVLQSGAVVQMVHQASAKLVSYFDNDAGETKHFYTIAHAQADASQKGIIVLVSTRRDENVAANLLDKNQPSKIHQLVGSTKILKSGRAGKLPDDVAHDAVFWMAPSSALCICTVGTTIKRVLCLRGTGELQSMTYDEWIKENAAKVPAAPPSIDAVMGERS